jgi:protein ImuB
MALLAGGSWNGNVMSAFSGNRRRILSLWLPRLPTDRIKRQLWQSGERKENASRQDPNNDPSIVVAKQNNALEIFALDDAAARLGLEVGLSLANARAICPQVRVYDADEVADAKALTDIAGWCDRFTPLVALDPPHGLFLDITGCVHLFSGEAAMMRLLCDVLTAQGFSVSAAIAGTAVCARTMNRHVHARLGDGRRSCCRHRPETRRVENHRRCRWPRAT